MSLNSGYLLKRLIAGLGIMALCSAGAGAQVSIYYKNFVHHADGSLCQHTPQVATFTAYLNNDQNKVLLENAPRWNSGEPNIAGNGTFGVELGNFIDPALAVGDSVFVRFTCNATMQQGVIADSVTGIPWFVFPQHLYLTGVFAPPPPQNIQVVVDTLTHQRIITWSAQAGLSYSIYRCALEDTIPTGDPRRLYTRIADNLTTGAFTDTSTVMTVTYAYILYATTAEGIRSSHSREVLEIDGNRHLTVEPRATTALLHWNPYQPPFGETRGYNIYRRSATGTYGEPVAYTGLDTTFTDSRLQLNTAYYYKVTARIDAQTEMGETPEVAAATLPSQAGFYSYANLKTAVVVYQNTNAGSISNADLEKIKTMCEVGKLFYWRNSGMKLNTELIYIPITAYRDFGDPGNTNVQQTVNDLLELGVMNTQYDLIFRVCPAVDGYWSYGVINLGFPGPSRATGFSHSDWPVGTGVVYPGHLPGINYGLTWIFVHEVQHAIDDLYRVNNHPEMYHGDVPWEFPAACGEHFDFQAKMFRTFNAYEDLLSNWGGIYEAADADQDGFPDAEPLLALDEARFGSSNQSGDSDGDGYPDRAEALDGAYSGSNPNDADSDNDGALDGQDRHPRYPVPANIPGFSPVIDGIVEAGWPLLNHTVAYTQESYSPKLYMCYDADSLYFALKLAEFGIPRISFDFHGDGFWWSSGNTIMRINLATGTFSEFHSWDASEEVKNWSLAHGGAGGMWDDDPLYQQQFNRRVIYPNTVHLEVTLNFPQVQIEIAIPKREYAGITLQPGDSLGLNVNYSNVNNISAQWAATFDQYSFVNFTLGGSVGVEPVATDLPITHYELFQNYPNPFNPETAISYQLSPKGQAAISDVELIICNVLGQKVRTLVNQRQAAGRYKVTWDGRDERGEPLSSGIYFYTLTAGDFRKTGKMVLAR